MQLPLDVSSNLALTGFEQAVKDSNQSELGRRNSGSMLSVQASERALLCYLMNRLNSLDPDVLVGHNVSAFDLDILLHRLQHYKVKYAAGLPGGYSALFRSVSATCSLVCVALTVNVSVMHSCRDHPHLCTDAPSFEAYASRLNLRI